LDVLMLSYMDHSNTGHRIKLCLEYKGLSVVFLKGIENPYKYPQQGAIYKPLAEGKLISNTPVLMNIPELRPLVERAKVVHYVSSQAIMTGADLTNKKVVVDHGGTVYRRYHDNANHIFNAFADHAVIRMTDLFGLGAKKETLITAFIDPDVIKPNFEPMGSRVVIGHFPSNPQNKGTAMIAALMKRLEKDPSVMHRFTYVGSRIPTPRREPWEIQLDLMRQCDIIIEACLPYQDGYELGEWGNNGVEIAGLGKALITHCTHRELYESTYGPLGFVPCNSEEEIEARIRELLSMGVTQLREEKERGYEWVTQYHTIKPTAERLWEKVYGPLM
jgi:hypothetical protein